MMKLKTWTGGLQAGLEFVSDLFDSRAFPMLWRADPDVVHVIIRKSRGPIDVLFDDREHAARLFVERALAF